MEVGAESQRSGDRRRAPSRFEVSPTGRLPAGKRQKRQGDRHGANACPPCPGCGKTTRFPSRPRLTRPTYLEEHPMTATLDSALVTDLTAQVSGSVLGAQDAGYDSARAVHNGLIDRRPALIVRCRTACDVAAALALARRAGLEVSIRGGGHNVAGRAVTDGGLMIDLAEMKVIAIDPDQATAMAEGGVIWGELNDAAAEHGLAVTGGAVSSRGIAGYTLGGGLGWLMSNYGLAADNLLAAELVTADGQVLRPSADEHPDLFWALRGGGGNFGVATSLEYQLHPLAMVTGGLIAHAFDAAKDVLQFYREF